MKVFKHQLWHFITLAFLFVSVYFYAIKDTSLLCGELWGIETVSWFAMAILIPVLHQIYVLVCWRLELHYNSISKTFGSRGFTLYKIGFAVLILLRPISIIFLAVSSSYTLDIAPALSYLFTGILLVPSVFLFYSVKKYFGINRAFGEDHFNPAKYKNQTFIKQGIFKYTSNGMYIYGFLILYIPGLLLFSKAGLLAALFNHIYIWVHYYCTELPDIKIIYTTDSR